MSSLREYLRTMLTPWRRNRRNRTHVCLWLNDQDEVTLDDLSAGGCLCVGGPGSGKTTGIYARLFHGVATHPERPGMLLLSAKQSDIPMFLHWAALAGRETDCVVLGPGESFNPIGFELAASGGNPDTVTPLLQSLKELQSRGKAHTGDEYFEPAQVQHVTQCVRALHLAGEPVCLKTIYDFLNSAPNTADDLPAILSAHLPSDDGKTAPYAFGVLNRLLRSPVTVEGGVCEDYWCNTWVNLGKSERTQSCIAFGALGLIQPLLTGAVGQTMAGPESTVTPRDITEHGRIVISGWPVLAGKESARLAAAFLKLSVQRHCLRRTDGRPVFIGCDEYHCTALPNDDPVVAAAGRSHRVAQFYALQNVNQLYGVLGGGQRGEHDGKALIGCCQLKLFGSNTCPVSNLFAADLIGQSRQTVYGGSAGGDNEPFDYAGYMLGAWQPRANVSWSRQLEYECPPNEFLRLRCGGPGNDWTVEAIAVHGGRMFRSSNKPWARCAIRQLL